MPALMLPQLKVGEQKVDLNRRDISVTAIAALSATAPVWAAPTSGISRNHAAIHQETMFAASPERVYRTLTTASLFDRVVRAGVAMNSSVKSSLGNSPTQIDARPGGAFTLFGGHITGINLELTPNTLLVQAWRERSWKTGFYSIARFAFQPQGMSTRLVFDHLGFPDEGAPHLADGWYGNYWTPLAKILAQTF